MSFAHIFTDSLSLVEKLRSTWTSQCPQSSTICKILTLCADLFHDRNLVVRIFWIAGHSNHPGNARADQLARAAQLLPPQVSDIGAETWHHFAKLAGRLPASADFPYSFQAARGLSWRLRRTTFALLTDYGQTRHYTKWRAGSRPSSQMEAGLCRFCALLPETPSHLVFTCTSHQVQASRRHFSVDLFSPADTFKPSLWPRAHQMLCALGVQL
jgi:hypothetical protein